MSVNPFTHLRSQVRACLEKEAKLPPDERRKHQWQFLTTVAGMTYIVGKGGANTMFYMIGTEGERKLCHPEEMLQIISKWGGAKYAMYAVCKTPKHFTHGPFPELNQALNVDADPGSYLVGLTVEGKVIRLYQMKQGLKSSKWCEFKRKKK